MNKKELYIIGAGGHCQSVISCFSESHHFSGIYDVSFNPKMKEDVLNIPLIGQTSNLPKDKKVVIAVGDNHNRAAIYKQFTGNIEKKSIIHKSAIVSPQVIIGNSNQIFPNVFINVGVEIGVNSILNTGCIIEHGTKLGSHNHISIGAVIAGRVEIGDFVFVGANSTIIENIKITSGVIIGAGGVVVKNITEPGTYVGNPLRKIK